MKKLLLFVIVAAAASGGLWLSGILDPVRKFFEANPPQIRVVSAPPGIGLKPAKGEIVVTDPANGLREVLIRAEQGHDVRELFRRTYDQRVYEDRITFDIPGKEARLPTRPLNLTILAIDRSMWSNTSSVTLDLSISYDRPRAEVLTAQHNIIPGGSGFSMYRVAPPTMEDSGIRVNDRQFPGYPTDRLSQEFKEFPEARFAFFAAPLGGPRPEIAAYVRNKVGNAASAPLPFHISRKKLPSATTELPEASLVSRIEALYPAFEQLTGSPDAPLSLDSPASIAAAFRLLNEDYRALLEKKLSPVFTAATEQKLWEGPFIRPVPGATKLTFGQRVHYTVKGADAGETQQNGMDLAAPPDTAVRAANNGIVVLAEDVGLYGNTVILDHGFGIFSLYSQLGKLSVEKGTQLETGNIIGTAGQTGLALSPHVHFEIRIHGVPVTPVEWWDGHWIKDHVQTVIGDIRKRLELEARG